MYGTHIAFVDAYNIILLCQTLQECLKQSIQKPWNAWKFHSGKLLTLDELHIEGKSDYNALSPLTRLHDVHNNPWLPDERIWLR